jgi:pimeloyl-ACP methyl ester carboxylesterase
VPEVRWDGGVRSLTAGPERADGPLVVLLPGLGALGYLVDTLVACGRWARSCLLDVPGFGHRPPRTCSPEVSDIAATVSRWLDLAAEDRSVVLAGHSTAAQAALHVAVARPDRVRALVLLGPTFPPAQRRFLPLARACLGDLPRENLGLVPAVLPYYLRGGADLVRMVRSAQRDRPEDVITAVGCPTLLIRGVHDTFAPKEWVDHLTATAPDGWSVTAPGAHTFPFHRGELTAELLARAAHRAGLTV